MHFDFNIVLYCTVLPCFHIEVQISAKQIIKPSAQSPVENGEPPLPPPSCPPSENEDLEDHAVVGDGDGKDEPLVPPNKGITSFKQHFKVSVSGGATRSFQHKFYGSAALALRASERFQKETNALLCLFESFKRKPVDRKNLLHSAGVDSKHDKSTTSVQKDMLTRRICNGFVMSIEGKILDDLFQHLTKDSDTSAWRISMEGQKFKATFQGAKHEVHKVFASLTTAVDWMRSMSIAEQVGAQVQKV